MRDRLDIVVRAFDPCISCSAHMAKVASAPADNWKIKLNEVQDQGLPIFVGVGNPTLGDDAAGIELAEALRKQGIPDVLLEAEIEEQEDLWIEDPQRPLIFLDALDFQETPGKVTLLPLNFVLQNTSLSHRVLPSVSGLMNYPQIKNAYYLGIQPDSLKADQELSPAVKQAVQAVLQHLAN